MIAHLLLSFVVGGAFIACCSLAAEFLGTEIGGIIAGLPSTLVITLLFVAVTGSPGEAVRETTFIPVVLGLNCLFFACYALVASRGAAPALARRIRERLEQEFDATFSDWVALLAEARSLVLSSIEEHERQAVFEELTDWRWLEMLRQHGAETTRQAIRDFVDRGSRKVP